MASRFWVPGGTGTWNATDTNNWSATSGGASGASVPTAADDVFLDSNSGAGAITVTGGGVAVCLGLNTTGFTGSFAGGSGTVNANGDVVLGAATTTGNLLLQMTSASGTKTLTSNGKAFFNLTVVGPGTVSLADALTLTFGTLTLFSGTFATNSMTVLCSVFSSSNSNTRTLTLGASSITINGANTTVWTTTTLTGLTMTANTAVITLTGNAASFQSGSLNFNGSSVVMSGTGQQGNLTGTVVNLTRTGTALKTDALTLGTTVTVTGTLTINGNSAANRILVQSSGGVGSSFARTVTAAAVVASNVDFMDVVAAGAASWNLAAITGGSGDAGGNSGITFTAATTRYAVVAGNSSSTATWSTTSGGAGGASVPLPQDAVILDATSAAGTYTNDMPRLGKDINFTGFTRTFSQGLAGATLYGSLTLGAGMTLGGTFGFTFGGRGVHTVASNGKTFPNALAFTAPGATYTLADALTCGSSITHNNGTLDTASFAVACSTFTSNTVVTRALTLGTSTVSLTSTSNVNVWNFVSTGLTLSAASSTITISTASTNLRGFVTGSGGGGALTYGAIVYTVSGSTGTLQFANSGTTIGRLDFWDATNARTLQFLSGNTYIINDWRVYGGLGRLVTVNAGTAGSAATISKSTGYLPGDYLSVQDITGTGGATFYMGSRSTSVSGNTGLTFTDAPQRFWVGGTDTWDATVGTKWAVVSGGTGGVAVPTVSDNVFFDVNSGTVTVTTTSGTGSASKLDGTGFTGTIAGGFTITVAGDIVLGAGGTWTGLLVLMRDSATSHTITSNGRTMAGLTIGSATVVGTVSLADALSLGSGNLTLTLGTFTTNNFAVTCGVFSSSNTNARTLTPGSSSFTVTSTGAAWFCTTTTNLTVTANTSTVTLTGAGPAFRGSINWNGMSVVLNASTSGAAIGGFDQSGTTTFANITLTTGTNVNKAAAFAIGGNLTATGTFTLTGNSTTNRVFLLSNTIGTARTVTAAVVVVSNADFMDITGAGAGSWNLAAAAGGSGDAGGNSGITFTPAVQQFWRNNGGNWSDSTHWSLTSGGGATGRVPLPQDNVRFDASSFAAASQTVTSDMPRSGADIDWTGVVNNPSWTNSGTAGFAFYGSLTMVAGMTLVGGTTGPSFAGRGAHTITSAGKTLQNSLNLTGFGGTYTMQDAFGTVGGSGITQSAGTLNTNGFALTTPVLVSTGSIARALILGASTVSLTGTGTITIWNVTATGMSLSAASSTIVLAAAGGSTRTWDGGGLTYGTLSYTISGSAGRLTMVNSDTFGTLNVFDGAVARILSFSNSKTVTVGNWNVYGRPGALITVQSNNAGFAATISKTSGYIAGDYLSVQDITGTGGATFYMGSRSTNVSGNTGLTFTDAPGQRYWVGGAGTWDGTTTTNWALFSGATGGIAVPTAATDVYFDANSGAGTVTATGGGVAVCNNLDCTGYSGTLTAGGITTNGNVTLSATMTAAGVSFGMGGVGTKTFTSAGRTITNLTINSSTMTCSLADALSMSGVLTLTVGTFTTNSFAVTCDTFSSSNSNTRTINLGASSITVTGSSGSPWTTQTNTGLTMNAGTSTVTATGSNITLSVGGGGTLWNVVATGFVVTTNAGFSCQNFTKTGTASKTDQLILAGGITCGGTFTVNGNSVTNRLFVNSNTTGTPRTVTAAVVVASNADFQDITGAGAASWNLSAIAGGSGDAGGNTGITFTASQTNYWVGNGGSWSDVSKWASTSGGVAGSGRVPLSQDDVRIDANSMSSAAQVVLNDMPRLGRDISFAGVTNTPTWSNSNQVTTSFGSVTFAPSLGRSAAFSQTLSGRGSHVIAPNGFTGTTWLTLIVAAPGGTYTLTGAITTTGSVTLTTGTFDTAGFNVTSTVFSCSGSSTRSLILGSTTWSLTSTSTTTVWNVAVTGMTLSAASSTIVITSASANARTFTAGSSFTYGTITYTVAGSTGDLNLSNSFTVGTLNFSDATNGRTLTFATSSTTVVTNWNVFGLVGKVVTVKGFSGVSTISKASGYLASDYVSVQDITGAATGATYYMGSRSTNVSGNTNLSFTDAPQRYWVGGTGAWDATTTTNWAVVSGGTGGLSVPTTSTDVFLDANSGTGTITITGTNGNSKSFVATGYAGTLAGTAGNGLTVVGTTVTFSSGMTITSPMTLSVVAGSGNPVAITTNGKSIPTYVQTSGNITLQDALSVQGGLTVNAGGFTTSNFAVTCGIFTSTTTSTRTITFGSSSVTLTGTGTVWNTVTVTGLTLTANTATVTLTGAAAVFSGTTLYNYQGLSVSFTGSGAPSVTSGTFANISRVGTASKTDTFTITNATTVTGTFTVAGNSATNRLLVQSNLVGTSRTVTAAAVVASNVDFMDIAGAGAASWNLSAITGGSGDAGGNSGITFTTGAVNYWVGGTGNWSDVTHWASSSGGVGGTGRVPLPQGTARFDSNSFTGAGQVVTIDMPRLAKDVDWSGVTNSPSSTFTASGVTTYGSWTAGPGVTQNSGQGLTFAGRGTHSITMSGRSFINSMTIAAVTGTYTLADAFTTAGNFTLANGTLNTNGMALTCLTFSSTGGATRALTLGTSTVSLTGTAATTTWIVSAAGLTLSAANSTIVFTSATANTRTFSSTGGAQNYGTLTYTVAASTGRLAMSTSTGSSFATINVSGGARELNFTSGTSTTVTNWNVFGAAGNLVTVNSSTPGAQSTLVSSSPAYSQYLSISDSNATGTTWYARPNSVDGGGNTGWLFTSPSFTAGTSDTITTTDAVTRRLTTSRSLSDATTLSDAVMFVYVFSRRLKWWNGSSWVPKPIKAPGAGSTWVAYPMYHQLAGVQHQTQ